MIAQPLSTLQHIGFHPSIAKWLSVLSFVTATTQAQEPSQAQVVDAAFTTGVVLDGAPADWSNLASTLVFMNTQGRGTNGTMNVQIRYAWNATNLFILVQELSNPTTSTRAQEAPNAESYQNTFYLFDCIAFWIDLDNNAGTSPEGTVIVENNADFQPWFGFSSSRRSDLIYGRANNSGNMNLDGLANAKVTTGGTFASHNRTIEAAIPWTDIASTVDPSRQPGGDLVSAIVPGYVFASEPLLINNDYDGQAFIGPAQYDPPSGTDTNSRDIRLLDVPASDPPSLTIRIIANTAHIEWPQPSTGFALETASELISTTTWSPVATVPVVNPTSERFQLEIPLTGKTGFYRLRKI